MCVSRISTVMTTIPKLRMALRKGNFVKTTPNTNRDPTYARKQRNIYAQMPSMVDEKCTSNTYTDPTALNQILGGHVSQAQATNKYPHQDQSTSKPDMQVGHRSGNSYSDGDTYREEGYDYKQTMREKNRCRTNTAPPGPKCMTSSKNCNDQELDPKPEGITLVASSVDEDSQPKQCR